MVQSLKKYIISTNLESDTTNKIYYCRAYFITISCGFSLFWINNPEEASDISSERITNIEVRSKVEEMMLQLDELKILLLAVITDRVPAYNAARKDFKFNSFLLYYAHQINLCVSEVFKVLSELKTTSQQALKLAVYFKNANNKYFIGKL
ncbi:unnamed protein product [Rhizophagus irregularis]|nr:unnamed protein product [Rhizophagus irregularis]CAB4446251.1 unnamed protein product [Rhizophagus irregularis]